MLKKAIHLVLLCAVLAMPGCTKTDRSEEAQKLILQGYMHSVFKTMEEIPCGSVDTNKLIAMDMGVNWENVFRSREEINFAWMDIVANR